MSTASALLVPTSAAGESLWADAMRRLRRNRIAVAGGIFLALIVLACWVLPELLGLDPFRQDPSRYNEAPSASHWFGTDNLGRDYAARVLVGGRTSLLVGLVGTFVSVVIGTVYGLVAGHFGGRIDDVMMRVVDFMYAIPYMFLVILITLLFSESSRGNSLPIFAAAVH